MAASALVSNSSIAVSGRTQWVVDEISNVRMKKWGVKGIIAGCEGILLLLF